MALRPWSKFYWADWRADPKLKLCSRAARSLWLDMCGLMHEAEPYGHLLVAGISPDSKQLAAILGDVPKDIARWVAELETAQVFSRTATGTIYSRRMVRDREREERDKANGKGGGNPRLKPSDNRGVNPPVKAQKPEARSQSDSEPNGSAAVAAPPDDRTWLFREGLAMLASNTGKPAVKLRPVVGRWLQRTGDDPAAIRAEIEAACDIAAPVADAVAWIEGRLKPRNGAQNGKFNAMLAGVLAAAGGSDAGPVVEPLHGGGEAAGGVEGPDRRLLGAPAAVPRARH